MISQSEGLKKFKFKLSSISFMFSCGEVGHHLRKGIIHSSQSDAYHLHELKTSGSNIDPWETQQLRFSVITLKVLSDK